ncbi:unnamed protein product [Arabidopsis lyrata]|nr:unnamed protein product [Arabidopsis lyrata]
MFWRWFSPKAAISSVYDSSVSPQAIPILISTHFNPPENTCESRRANNGEEKTKKRIEACDVTKGKWVYDPLYKQMRLVLYFLWMKDLVVKAMEMGASKFLGSMLQNDLDGFQEHFRTWRCEADFGGQRWIQSDHGCAQEGLIREEQVFQGEDEVSKREWSLSFSNGGDK